MASKYPAGSEGQFGSRPALPVPDGEPDWESGSPKTAEEYLKRVRWESAQCAQTKCSEIDVFVFEQHRTEYIPRFKHVAEAPMFCQPTTTWIKQTLTDFHKARKHFENLDGEDTVLLAVGEISTKESEEPELSLDPSHFEKQPKMEELEAMNQVETIQLLRFHVREFLKLKLSEATDCRCFWLYSLLSRIHRPLHDTTAAAVRSLFTKCCHLRSQYSKLLTGEQGPRHEDLLPRLNLLIAICGVYFGQDEQLAGMVDIDDLQRW